MTRWEYIEIKLPGNSINTEELNKLGAEGWELVHVKVLYHWYTDKESKYVFKRPLI